MRFETGSASKKVTQLIVVHYDHTRLFCAFCKPNGDHASTVLQLNYHAWNVVILAQVRSV
jgi:hypothetical protein